MHHVLVTPADYQDCLEAMRLAFATFPLPVRGARVLLKPNVLRSARPEEAITTHPAILAAAIACLKDMGVGRITVGDNPGLMSYGANEASFARCGLLEAAGEHYRNIGLDAVEVPFDSAYGGRLSVSREVLEADLFISMPKFKTHGLTVLTGAIKNSYGILPGAQKANLHKLAGGPARFHDLVVDVFRLRVPDLFIMDAVLGMQGNGPASTELRWIGRLLAADNAVGMDAVVARMMGLEPARLRFLQRAKELGLGDFEAVEVQGAAQPIPDFKVPPLGGEALEGNTAMQNLLCSRAAQRPVADPERCTGCGTCVAQCPASALTLVESGQGAVPQVDPALCIACFCCQEMCPEKAISLQTPACPASA
jgi:uncharacterized protein (DUF362 family)/ferredoxin